MPLKFHALRSNFRASEPRAGLEGKGFEVYLKAFGLKGFRLSGIAGTRALRFAGFPVFVSWEQRAPGQFTPQPKPKTQTQYHVSRAQSAPGPLAAIELPRNEILFLAGAECSSCVC